MATSYPAALDAFTPDIAAADTQATEVGGRTHREMHNDANSAIVAVETELGVDPAGASATVVARLNALDTTVGGKVAASLFDANSILAATSDDTPAALTVGASTIVGRKATGGIAALTGAEAGPLLSAIAPSGVTGTAAVLPGATFTGPVSAPAATTSITSIRLPHGTAPTTPTDGDMWTTTTGVFAQVSSATKRLATTRTSLYLPGTSGNYASAPYVAGMGITGDIDMRWVGSMDDWTPQADNATQIARFSTTAVADKTFIFGVNDLGKIYLHWWDGSTVLLAVSTVATGFPDGAIGGIRMTLDVDNGAGAYEAKSYTSADEGATWAQLGATVSPGGTTTIVNSTTAPLEIGSYLLGTERVFPGRTLRAEVRNGIGGAVVASPDFTAPMGPRQRDAQANIWTVNGSAWAWELS